jgi:hypothetical protein
LGEVEPHGGGEDFKLGGGWGGGIDRGFDLLEDLPQIVAIDRLVIYTNPFRPTDQMRGGVAARAIASGGEDGGNVSADGAFAVGARDVNDGGAIVGIVEGLEQLQAGFESEVDAEAGKLLEKLGKVGFSDGHRQSNS